MVKAGVLRSRSVGTKVTEEEYARLEALAGGQSMSEWVRDVLLSAGERAQARPADEAVLSELLALRAILLNVHFKVANGQRIDVPEMEHLIERADAGKLEKARERLNPTGEPETR